MALRADISDAADAMSVPAPRVAMVAGETSGDLLAGLLLDGMQSLWPQLQAHGIGGAQRDCRIARAAS